jgi:GMP synthase-like glutamine amidotransferase
MKIAALFHVPYEKLGLIEDWILERGHELTEHHLYNNDPLPDVTSFDMLIVMGGSMGANDEGIYPWLRPEKNLIRKCIDAGKPVLGICLGSQLIASALGSRVYKGKEPEIGWFPLTFHVPINDFPGLPAQATVFHWHGDTYDLPEGAVALASSDVTPVQGFVFRQNVIALQFHLEIKPENISLMLNHGGDDLVPASHVQSAANLSEGLVNRDQSGKILHIFLDALEKSLSR